MQKTFLLTAFVCLWLSTMAQINKIKTLSIGDTLPNIPIIFSKASTLKTSLTNNLQRKLIVLDFWNIWCGSCIAAMPKMNALQKQFGDEVQVILITKNNAEEVDNLFDRIKVAKPDLPMIIGDTMFNLLFPHEGEPLHVWIDESKVIRHITDGHNATSENFIQFLKQVPLKLPLRSELVNFDPSRSLLVEAAGRLSYNAKQYSLFLDGLSNLTGLNYWSLTKDSSENSILFKCINRSALSLFGMAYNKELYGFDVNLFDRDRNNRIVSPLSLHPIYDSILVNEWNAENLYTYELKMENVTEDQFYEAMQEDLKRYLPFKVKIERKKTKCLVLIKNDKVLIRKTVHPNLPSKAEFTKEGFCMINASISSLLKPLLYINHMIVLPIIDETHYDECVDMCLPSKLFDLPKLRESLYNYGFDLIEAEREIKMLVITPRD
ncbi:MAG: TlpA disulfide reductase family protein [Chitinophagaceae bacterium]